MLYLSCLVWSGKVVRGSWLMAPGSFHALCYLLPYLVLSYPFCFFVVSSYGWFHGMIYFSFTYVPIYVTTSELVGLLFYLYFCPSLILSFFLSLYLYSISYYYVSISSCHIYIYIYGSSLLGWSGW